MSRKIKYLIISSLLLNLLLIGAGVGYWTQCKRDWHKPPFKEDQLAKLVPEHRAALKEMMDNARKEGRARWKEIRKERKEAARILAAKEFDASAYDAQMEKIGALHRQRAERMAENIKKLAATWPQEERKVLAEMLRHPPRFRHEGGSKKPDGDELPPPPPM